MTYSGLTVIDGTQLMAGDLFVAIPDGALTGAGILEVAESEVSRRLFGISLPERLKPSAKWKLDGGYGFRSREFDGAEFRKMVQEYLLGLADELKDSNLKTPSLKKICHLHLLLWKSNDPLVISVLDGSALRLFLDDEDDFAILAEDLFTDLDVDDKGKINKNEMQNVLVHMGVEMGVPSFTESDDLLKSILKKHGADGEEKVGQAQFAQLLQLILQDLADALAKRNVAIVRKEFKVINGFKLGKILADEKLSDDLVKRLFQKWDTICCDEEKKDKLWSFLEAIGFDLGLPTSESNPAVELLYGQLFSSMDKGIFAVDFNRDTFQLAVKGVLKMFTQLLQASPVLVELENESY